MHEGHRDRLKNKFLNNGIDGFEPHEILELALFYAIPRKDTNELAHRLLSHFGNFTAVLEAPVNCLTKIDGIGKSAAIFLKLIPCLSRIYYESKCSCGEKIPTLSELRKSICTKFIGRTSEVFMLFVMDAKGKLICEQVISTGNANAVNINMKKVIEIITSHNAASVIVAHNHPSGIALTSRSDLISTKKLSTIFSSMGIAFLDHIIVCEDEYVSLKECTELNINCFS